MRTIYIDADACPVKEEAFRVARRYQVRVVIVAKATQRVPAHDLIELVVRPGFGEVDDWIAETVDQGDIVITSDIPLAARCLAKDARVIDPKGNPFSEKDIGSALALRELMQELRQSGTATGGPAPLSARDRSRFLSRLDEAVNAVRRSHPPKEG